MPEHPFNLQNAGTKTYSQWQYEMGEDTIAFYLKKVTSKEMFLNKTVLDIGCGAGGKTMYFASQGVSHIYGMDVVDHYREDAEAFAKEKGMEDRFSFVLGDAHQAPFADACVDTIIMNDAMEHVADLAGTSECYRILKPKGRLYVNFPPFNHPYGAHLKDCNRHSLGASVFSDKTMIEAYKRLVSLCPTEKCASVSASAKEKTGRSIFPISIKSRLGNIETISKKLLFRFIITMRCRSVLIFGRWLKSPLSRSFSPRWWSVFWKNPK